MEKETNEQRERDAAERSYQKVEELAKKEEERRAYEEVVFCLKNNQNIEHVSLIFEINIF